MDKKGKSGLLGFLLFVVGMILLYLLIVNNWDIGETTQALLRLVGRG